MEALHWISFELGINQWIEMCQVNLIKIVPCGHFGEKRRTAGAKAQRQWWAWTQSLRVAGTQANVVSGAREGSPKRLPTLHRGIQSSSYLWPLENSKNSVGFLKVNTWEVQKRKKKICLKNDKVHWHLVT